MSDPRGASELLAFARRLLHVTTFEELLLVAQAEIAASLGYQHAWLFVAETPDAEVLRLLDVAGARGGLVRQHAELLVVRGDAMLEEILAGDAPVVVVDARTDPRTDKDIVAKIGNRTIINVPLRLIDKPFGALGTGTFGDEGCRPPSPQDLEYLIGMSAHLAVAAGRIRFLEERKAAELALRRTEEQLREAQKMEAIGQLAGGIAHDFNNLLSVILSYSTFALDGLPQGSPARADIEQITLAGRRAAELTRQLLAFSRQQIVEPRVLDLDLVIRSIATLIGRVIAEDIELVVRPGDSLGKIRADAGQLDQVLLNLVVNARDAMPSGGRLVLETANVELDAEYASAHLGVTPGPYVRLAVSDTGVGMTPEVQARIFEPFFTTKEQGRGTGLGLATVYGIVRQAGGHVWVYSEPGRGTTFRLYFPRVDADVDEPRTPPPAVTTLAGTETILLTEDNAQVREVVSSVLARSGYDMLVASGGDEALALAEAAGRPIHLLVTDVVMPGVTGPELAARLRTRWPALRVLCMSGYTGGLLASQGRLAGELPLLEKPITPPSLLRKVREVLDAPPT